MHQMSLSKGIGKDPDDLDFTDLIAFKGSNWQPISKVRHMCRQLYHTELYGRRPDCAIPSWRIVCGHRTSCVFRSFAAPYVGWHISARREAMECPRQRSASDHEPRTETLGRTEEHKGPLSGG